MSETNDAPAKVVSRGGTRFRRAGLLFIPAMIGVLVLTLATLFGILPLNLYLTGQDFKLSSNGGELVAKGLTLHGDQVQMKFHGKRYPIASATIDEAELKKGLCLSLTLDLPIVGKWTVRIQTDGDTLANDLTLGAVNLDGSPATLQGSKAHPVSLGPSVRGGAGLFGVDANKAVLRDVKASGKSAKILGTVNLRGIAIPRIHKGTKGSCY
jgi:hypothetical protein